MIRSKFQGWGVGLLLLASLLILLGTVTQTPILLIVGLVIQIVAVVMLAVHVGTKHSERRDR
ncbi:hypothetical protein [Terribacillus saccharophilus]|uniref:hypothetical protein n=1 Tax=Terribacillus saccharophilus TaxID=361277 RepID=UPI002DD00BAC|nr:hypothetical protein [Terribacillus saccharophilus]MEC0290834.1 hypothetical protein [Terribacillus saccharophilus]